MMKNQVSREDFKFWTSVRSRWNDMDGLRHINHATYLSYMETARLDLYLALGYDYKRWDQKESTILASMKIDYLLQTSHPAEFEIGQTINRVGEKSFDILTAIFVKGNNKPVLQATFTLVAFNYELGQTIPVPEIFQKFHSEDEIVLQ